MKILITGKGGREHALAHALRDSSSHPRIYVCPGSDGMNDAAERVSAESIGDLVTWMKQERIDLCVAGEESWLAGGLSDRCEEAGIRSWGPIRNSARLETSKIFAKDFLMRHGIPTGTYRIAASSHEAMHAAETLPCVLKYDGLAAGKGVTVCFSRDDVEAFVEKVYVDRCFGEGRIIIEEFLEGKELSVITAVADGQYQLFTPARDYKRQLDNDEGPNTGGMGAVASRALVSDELMHRIERELIQPVVNGLSADGLDYRGFLYFGIMLTESGPKMLEFNCRFGDPEAQAILPLVHGDLARYLHEAAGGELHPEFLSFDTNWNVCVVLASGDYPEKAGHGEIIMGLDQVHGARVFHAGTEKDEKERFVVNGGRVLSVAADGTTRQEAVEKVYREVKKIHFDRAQYRSDIGRLHFEIPEALAKECSAIVGATK